MRDLLRNMLPRKMVNAIRNRNYDLSEYYLLPKKEITYANDLWLIPKEGGTAIKLSSPAGVESYPKFSPDGKSIAFSANYDGNYDAYALSSSGGVPVRLTSHGYPDRVVEWTTDGKRVLFASSRAAWL